MEKPLCATVAEADGIKARLDGQVLMVGHITHFSPGIRAFRDLLEAGAIGAAQRLSLSRTHLGPIYPETDVLTEVAAHDVAILLSLVSEPPSVLAAWGAGRLGGKKPDIAHLVLSWNSGLLADIDVQWTSALRRRRLVAEGSRGTLVFEADTGREEVSIHEQDDAFAALKGGESARRVQKLCRTQAVEVEAVEPLRCEMAEFLACVEQGREPEMGFAFGQRVVGILEAARASMGHQGARQELPC